MEIDQEHQKDSKLEKANDTENEEEEESHKTTNSIKSEKSNERPDSATITISSNSSDLYSLTFSRKDSAETLRCLIAATLGVPLDTIGGLEEKSTQKLYTYSPSILHENKVYEVINLIPFSQSSTTYQTQQLTPQTKDKRATQIEKNQNLVQTPASITKKKTGVGATTKGKRSASPEPDDFGTPIPPKRNKSNNEQIKTPIATPKPTKKFDPDTLSPAMKECHGVITAIKKHQYAWVFNKPVDPVAQKLTDYLDIIKKPMDLGTVLNNIENGVYSTPEEMASDVRLVFTNALTYNPPDSEVAIMANSLSTTFEKKFAAMKNVKKIESNINTTEKSQVKEEEEAKDMTSEEKAQLSENINELAANHLGELVQIIHQRMPNLVNSHPDEIEIDLQLLDAATLRYLEKYVSNCLEKQKSE